VIIVQTQFIRVVIFVILCSFYFLELIQMQTLALSTNPL